MRFEILGPLRVVDDAVEIDLGGPRQQRVLALLLAAGPHALHVDRLVEETWGDGAPGTARHVIRTYLSNLRKGFGDRIMSDGQRYRIDTGRDAVDAIEFAELVEQGRAWSTGDPLKASHLLNAAADLWRGRPFGELGDGSILVEQRAAELEELHLQSIEALMTAELALGHHQQIIARLESLVGTHPFREVFHQQAMLALHRAGRQAEAVRVGWNLRNTLADELGLEPATETRALEDRILLQDPGLDLAPPTNLPAFVSSFVGRGRETAEVSKLLDVDRMVTLIGVGGVGKTRLAREVGEQVRERFADGVWWVDLASLAAAGEVWGKLIEALRLVDQPGVTGEALLLRYLAHREALLVFDNCEHVADDVAKLAMVLLEGAPGLKVLATSRRGLHSPGEVRYEVGPMSLPLGNGALGISDAERLFVERSTQMDDGFVAAGDIAADVARICGILEGLPLAVEMAAGRITVLSPGEIADRLGDRLGFLTALGSAEGRHGSLAAAIDWSYDLLTSGERLLFDRLSVFVGSFDLAAIEAVAMWEPLSTDDVLESVASLVDASMVGRERAGDGTVRYRLLDTLRDYGRAHLVGGGESEAAAQHHSRYFLGKVERSARLRFTSDHQAAMESLDAANDDLLAALDWSLDHESRSITLQAAPGLTHYWFWRADPAQAYRYGKRMLGGAESAPRAMSAGAELCVGFGSQLIGDFAGSAEAMRVALELLEEGEDWRLLLWAWNGQGQGGVFMGMPDMTRAMGRRILDLCEAHGERLGRAYGLALLGEAEFFGDGDFGEARRYLAEAIPLLRELGDEAALNLFALGILASVAALQLDFETAEPAAVETTTIGGPGWSATALINLGGFVLHPRGDTDRAEEVVKRGIVRVHERSMEVWVRTGLLFLGRIAAQRGRWEDAARLFGGCRPHLPPWSQHPRWWNYEPVVREALGDERYDEIAAAAAEEQLDDLVIWATA